MFIISCNDNPKVKANKTTAITLDTSYSIPYRSKWNTELISFPIEFAPGIPYKGVEDIRFAPGWNDVTSEEYWTYCFLWSLQDNPKTDARIIENNLKTYYKGLIGSNTKKNKIPDDKLIITETSFKKVKTDKNDIETFEGTIHMLDYMRQEPITLNCRVHLISCSQQNNVYQFYEISPQPLTHNIWKILSVFREGFKCIDNKEGKIKKVSQ